MKTRTALLMVVLVAGCYVGRSVSRYPPAIGPQGVSLNVWLANGAEVEGELLTVTKEDLTLRADSDLVRISARIIEKMKPEVRSTSIAVHRAPLADDVVSMLRPLSRFPAGIPDEALRNMLAVRGQSSVRVLTAEESR